MSFRLSRPVTNLVLSWNDRSGAWADSFPKRPCCWYSQPTHPEKYQIQASGNSTDGNDGDWVTVLDVDGNRVGSRIHEVNIGGRRWVKFVQFAGVSQLDEFTFADADAQAGDAWFFLGNSITELSFKWYPVDTTFSDLVAATDSDRFPTILRGGISGVKAWEVANSIAEYREFSVGAKYWAIELGTNDMWSRGRAGLPDYRAALTKIVEAAQANGAVPIIARVMSTDTAKTGWQVDAGYLDAVDSIAATYGLPAGPDLHEWFLVHPEELLPDGIHPNLAGAASIHRLWSEVALRVRAHRFAPRAIEGGRTKAFLHVFGAGGNGGAGIDVVGRPYSVGSGVGYQRRWTE